MTPLRIVVGGLLLGLVVTTEAAAQIFTWQDEHGAMVLSNRPRSGGGAMTTVVGASPVTSRLTTSGKSSPYDHTIEQQASKHGLSPDLVRAVIEVESAFNPRAVSPKGAMGLMQLMPATASEMGVRNPFHPEQNIEGGAAYLRQLLDRYDNKVDLALAAYNAGPASVEKYGTVPPYSETRTYVRKVTATSGTATGTAPSTRIFRWTETIDGRVVVRYSNKPPASGPYETVNTRR